MTDRNLLKGMRDLVLHRLVANYWSMPLVAVILAPIAAGAVLMADRGGLGAEFHDRRLSLLANGDAAQDTVIAIVGIDAALLTLYWSVTLIVLTLATASLGVRLVDRWLDKGRIRSALAGLTFCLVFALIVLTRIDPGAPARDLPHFALAVLFVLHLANLVLLGVAIHDLGRTMFIDRSIAHIGLDAKQVAVPIVAVAPYGGAWQHRLLAPRQGYVEGIDLDRLCRVLEPSSGAVRLCAAPGHYVMEGEPLALFQFAPRDDAQVLGAIPLGDYRSSVGSTVFEVRLLVEIAARALSPGINDPYTALACCDQLAAAIVAQAETWVDEGQMPAYEAQPRFELPGQDFRGLFSGPLKSLRQAAADYPSVTIRMIGNLARAIALLEDAGAKRDLVDFLVRYAGELRDHGIARASFALDRDAIAGAFAAAGAGRTR